MLLVSFQFYLSYHLYIVACAGAGATVIALVRSLPPMSLHLCMVCINGSCVKCCSSHYHVVDVTAQRNITRRLSLSSMCCSICIVAHFIV